MPTILTYFNKKCLLKNRYNLFPIQAIIFEYLEISYYLPSASCKDITYTIPVIISH